MITALPVPELLPVMVTQATFDFAVHAHPSCTATLTLSLPPRARNLTLTGETSGKVQGGGMYVMRSVFGDPDLTSSNRPVVANSISFEFTNAGVAVGYADRIRAATPATCGDAMEVPVMVAVAVSEVLNEEVIEPPGAKISTHGPMFEEATL